MASIALKSLYRKARTANVGCIVGENALSAWRAAKILRKWEALETMGAVRLRAEWDDSYDPHDFDPPEPDDTEAYGVIGEYRTDFDNPDWYPADVDDDELDWEHADSVWGNAGYDDVTDWRENSHVLDIMETTMDAFRDAWEASMRAERDRTRGLCPTCHGTGRAL
jgi:hypothetical protein